MLGLKLIQVVKGATGGKQQETLTITWTNVDFSLVRFCHFCDIDLGSNFTASVPATTVISLNIRRILMGNKIVDHSDVVGASPELHVHSRLDIWLQGIRQRQTQDSTRIFLVLGFGESYFRD